MMRFIIGPPSTRDSITTRSSMARAPLSSALPRALLRTFSRRRAPVLRRKRSNSSGSSAAPPGPAALLLRHLLEQAFVDVWAFFQRTTHLPGPLQEKELLYVCQLAAATSQNPNPSPRPLPEAERGSRTCLSPPLRLGEGAGG